MEMKVTPAMLQAGLDAFNNTFRSPAELPLILQDVFIAMMRASLFPEPDKASSADTAQMYVAAIADGEVITNAAGDQVGQITSVAADTVYYVLASSIGTAPITARISAFSTELPASSAPAS